MGTLILSGVARSFGSVVAVRDISFTVRPGDAFDGPAADVLAKLADRPGGAQWLEAWTGAQQPWFNFSAGSGFYHSDKVWAEHLDIPLGFITSYIAKARKGEQLDRPAEAIAAERDRIVGEYAEPPGDPQYVLHELFCPRNPSGLNW